MCEPSWRCFPPIASFSPRPVFTDPISGVSLPLTFPSLTIAGKTHVSLLYCPWHPYIPGVVSWTHCYCWLVSFLILFTMPRLSSPRHVAPDAQISRHIAPNSFMVACAGVRCRARCSSIRLCQGRAEVASTTFCMLWLGGGLSTKRRLLLRSFALPEVRSVAVFRSALVCRALVVYLLCPLKHPTKNRGASIVQTLEIVSSFVGPLLHRT